MARNEQTDEEDLTEEKMIKQLDLIMRKSIVRMVSKKSSKKNFWI